MKTFTLDTWYGKDDPALKGIEDKARKAISAAAEQFIKDCISNDVEVSSAEGLFYNLVFQELTTARLKAVDEVRKEAFKEDAIVYFISRPDSCVVRAVITDRDGGMVTVKGLDGDYKDKYMVKVMADLFQDRESVDRILAAGLSK